MSGGGTVVNVYCDIGTVFGADKRPVAEELAAEIQGALDREVRLGLG